MKYVRLLWVLVLSVSYLRGQHPDNDDFGFGYDPGKELRKLQSLRGPDDLRRIEMMKSPTFDADGLWIYADPDWKATYARQMRELGWDDEREVRR